MEKLVAHPWLQELFKSKKSVSVIDICSGTGIEGVAFCKVLKNKDLEVSLALIDLRLSALEKGKKFALKELGVEPITMMADITQPLILGEKYDIALLWGLAIPHFSPWKWVRVLVNILNILVDDGLFMYDEGDRVYNTFIIRGFREIILQVVEENRVVLDIFADRNSRTGDVKKLYCYNKSLLLGHGIFSCIYMDIL